MVNTAWQRLEATWGKDAPFDRKAVAAELGISYQAANKLMKGGGMSYENAVKWAKPRGLNPEWVFSGESDKSGLSVAEPPPPSPGPKFTDNHRLTPQEWEMWQAFVIAATKEEKQTIFERYEMVKQMAEHSYRKVISAKAAAKKKPDK